MIPKNTLALLVTLSGIATWSPLAHAEERATDGFRDKHAAIRVHLGHLAAWAGSLDATKAPESRATMNRIVTFLEGHIVAHAKAEEAALYPVVDRHASGDAKLRYTDTMRHEHGIIGDRIQSLGRASALERPDIAAFARETFALLGIIEAHFDKEEQVLLPVLDAHLTKEAFEREVGSKLGNH